MKSGAANADELRGESIELGDRIDRGDERLREIEGDLDDLLLRIPNPPDPDVPVGPPDARRRRSASGASRSRTTPTAGSASRTGKSPKQLGIIDLAAGAKVSRQRFPAVPRRRGAAGARPDQLGSGRALDRARHDRDLAARCRQPGLGAWHRADPGQGRPDVRRDARRPVPDPDGRGAGHQHPPRRDHRCGAAANSLRRLRAQLPTRSRRRRSRDARHPARPPVRQGRDGRLHRARRTRRPSSSG